MVVTLESRWGFSGLKLPSHEKFLKFRTPGPSQQAISENKETRDLWILVIASVRQFLNSPTFYMPFNFGSLEVDDRILMLDN